MALGSKAHFLYGQNTPSSFTTDLVPRSKYNFKVSMTHRTPAALGGLTTTDFERISSVSMPGLSVKTNTLNQYNRKRVVQTGIEYAPSDMFENRDWGADNNPFTAVQEFLKENDAFKIDKFQSGKLLISSSPDGYLKRIK